ncbi:asparagine synthase (glutamine-hydrolyzing) [Thermosulfuriphilus sp.]
MCGIAGFLDLEGHQNEELQRLIVEMTRILTHRGPDEEGVYFDAHIALGHRRLAIIDLSSGRQPMGDKDLGVQIVFNGEIYNFRELRRILESMGHRFQTNSDTEVILRAYLEWGPECVRHLLGMFAFAIWDASRRRLFLARDRLGKKPLYYWTQGSRFAFASEIKALLKIPDLSPQVDLQALDCYFSFGYIPSPKTIFQSIRKIPPAHYLLVSEKGLELTRYWEVDFRSREIGLEEALEEFWPLAEEAVRVRLLSEVPLGAFLSGGIDSPLVVALMARELSDPVLTNSIGFNDPRLDELPVAREIARYLGTEHHEFTVSPQVKEILPRIAWHFDEPLADSSALPTYYVCLMARQNVTVALSGDGGDESFGGYTFRYIPHLWESRLRKKIPLPLRTLIFSVLGELYPRSARLPRPLRLKTLFENLAVSDARAFYQDLIWLPEGVRRRIYSPSFLRELAGFSPFEIVEPLYRKAKDLDPVSRCQYVDLHFYLPEDVLVKVDRMSMAVSLEVRSPLLDHRIIEFATSLPLCLKVQGNTGKVILRRATEKLLPPTVVQRPKQGFSIPEAEWLRGELRPLVEEALGDPNSLIRQYLLPHELKHLWQRHLSGQENHSVFFWGILMLSLWERHYL